MSAEVKQVVDELGRAFEEFKAARDAELVEMKKGLPDPLLTEKVDRVAADVSKLSSLKDRLDRVEAAVNRPDFGSGEKGKPEEVRLHEKAFSDWMRDPSSPETMTALKQAERALRIKDVSGATPADGGYAVPEQIDRMIAEILLELSPMRQVCNVIRVGTRDYKKLVDIRGMSYGWVGETDSRSATTTPQLAEVAPTFGTLYAYPAATEESLQDMFFDVPGWLTSTAAEEFAKGEGIAFISGNGTNKPTGLLNGSKAATGDYDSPARAFGTLEYVATGVSADFANSRVDSPPGDPGDVFITLAYKLKQGYRRNARWAMNKNTLASVMKFKDSDGDYLWRPGLAAGQPSTLIGYPLVEMEDWPDIAADSYSVGFGDFRAAYQICDLVGTRITVDDNITAPGYVKWYIRRRLGGKLIKDEALKLIKFGTS